VFSWTSIIISDVFKYHLFGSTKLAPKQLCLCRQVCQHWKLLVLLPTVYVFGKDLKTLPYHPWPSDISTLKGVRFSPPLHNFAPAHLLGLRKIDFSADMGFKELGAVLAKVLEQSHTLESLILRENNTFSLAGEEMSRALAKNTSLSLLDLRGSKLSIEAADHLATALSVNSRLRVLDISDNNPYIDRICDVLQINTTLQVLHIGGAKLTPSGAALKSFARMIAANQGLTHLSLVGEKFESDALKDVAESLQANKRLQIFACTDSSPAAVMNLNAGMEFAKTIQSNLYLRSLNLHVEAEEDAAAQIVSALAFNSSLTEITLPPVRKPSDPYGEAVQEALQSHPSLRIVRLSRLGSKGSHMWGIASALHTNRRIQQLEVSHSSVSSCVTVAAMFSVALSANSSLQILELPYLSGPPSVIFKVASFLRKLDLSSSMGLRDDLPKFVDFLKSNQSLTWLNISKSRISDDSGLVQALKTNTTLTHLDLSANLLTRPEIVSTSTYGQLRFLSFSSNELSDYTVVSMFESLKLNSTLTQLDLMDAGVTPYACRTLSELLKVNTSLIHVDIRKNGISSSAAAMVQEAQKQFDTTTVLMDDYFYMRNK
jgi:hypothetical protein